MISSCSSEKTPDAQGARRVILGFDAIQAVKILDAIELARFTAMGFPGDAHVVHSLLFNKPSIQGGVGSIQSDQVLMSPSFNDSTMIQHEHLIRVANGAESMCNDKARTSR